MPFDNPINPLSSWLCITWYCYDDAVVAGGQALSHDPGLDEMLVYVRATVLLLQTKIKHSDQAGGMVTVPIYGGAIESIRH